MATSLGKHIIYKSGDPRILRRPEFGRAKRARYPRQRDSLYVHRRDIASNHLFGETLVWGKHLFEKKGIRGFPADARSSSKTPHLENHLFQNTNLN